MLIRQSSREEPGASPSTSRRKKGKSGRNKGRQVEAEIQEVDDDDDFHDFLPLCAVVKVFTTHSYPHFSLPWQKRRQIKSSGSGFIIDGKRVLTNAHCVEYGSQVQVKRRGSDTKYAAKVEALGFECDLAVLSIEDDFWTGGDGIVKFSKKMPTFGREVCCAGYPIGGETLSVTDGVVSRIEVTNYTNAQAALLGCQIDAAINPGNSGGPAFNTEGLCVGVAFQSMNAAEAENIAYIIPVPVVEHFLRDVKTRGSYTGFPRLGISVQGMENASLRRAHKMDSGAKGVLVRSVQPTGCMRDVLKPADVVTHIGGESIGNDGTFVWRKHERMAFSWLVAQKFFGDSIKISILREGEPMELTATLEKEHELVSSHLHDMEMSTPSYIVIAGLVYTVLTVPYMRSEFGEEWEAEAPVDLVMAVMHREAKMRTEQLVVLSHILSHDSTIGYDEMENILLVSFNETKVENLQHLLDLTYRSTDEFLCFEFTEKHKVVVEREGILDRTRAVCQEHSISSPISSDLRLPGLVGGGGAASPPASSTEES